MKILSVVIALMVIFYLTACNSIAEFGKYLQQSGKVLERLAEIN